MLTCCMCEPYMYINTLLYLSSGSFIHHNHTRHPSFINKQHIESDDPYLPHLTDHSATLEHLHQTAVRGGVEATYELSGGHIVQTTAQPVGGMHGMLLHAETMP